MKFFSSLRNGTLTLLVKVFGPSWKTSLAGYGQLFAVTAYQGYQAFSGKELNQHDVISLIVSAGVAVGLRAARDHHISVPDSVSQGTLNKITDKVDAAASELESKLKKSPEAAVAVVVLAPPVTPQAPVDLLGTIVLPPAPGAPRSIVDSPAPIVASPVNGYAAAEFVTSDPDFTLTGRATVFGLDYDGHKDPEDNGIGAWGAPTANKNIIGVSLPEGVMIATFGFSGTWKENVFKVGAFLAKNKVQVYVTHKGKTVAADVCDAGPARMHEGKLLHNAIDLTYALAHSLDTGGDAIVSYQIFKGSAAMKILGWDRVNNCEIDKAGIA